MSAAGREPGPGRVEREPRSPAISVRLPVSVKAAAEKAARADLRTLNSLVEKALTEYLRAKGFLPDDPAA